MDLARSFGERFEKALESGDPNQSMSARWSQILGVPDQSPDLYLALSVMLQQTDDLIGEIASAPGISERAKGLYSAATTRLIPFIHPAKVNGQNLSALQKLRDSIDLLFLASDGLADRLVPDIQPSTLEELCNELVALRTSAAEADVPPEIRRLITTSLDTLLMALRSYDLLGAQGVARIYGSVAAELARVAGDKNTPKKAAGLLQNTVKTVKTIGAVVVWAGASVTGAHALLTHGPEVVDEVTAIVETGELPKGSAIAAPAAETKQGSADERSSAQPSEQAAH